LAEYGYKQTTSLTAIKIIMIDRQQLLKDLQRELPKIEKDILAYSESKPELTAHLQDEYKKAQAAGRTADHFVAWREAQTTQAAVAWVLTCVFVRFLEDNVLLVQPVLSGPAEYDQGKKPLQHAKERMVAYFNENPTHAEREYLLSIFEQLEKFPVIAELLDHKHNPLWQIPISADGAKQLIDFFQKIDVESGEIVHNFTDENWDTRFLGDLYQDLSETVRKKYALLQTPEFVESFILDYTLEKAKETFGLEGLRLIDPTCGSGHFLLTTFERCFDDWVRREPSTNTRELAQRALDVVHGVDINPYAIAICRFRLLIAAMKVCGSRKVKDAPNFKFNLACGDSLLHGKRFEWQGQGIQNNLIDEDPIKHVFEVEDKNTLERILGQQYHAVVGNPPYIIVKDKNLNQAYRERYLCCKGKYSLAVPFMERFFELAFSGDGSGYIGQITTNAFMKREFGVKLIEDFFPKKNLTHIIDSSGALIPGHGTPTIILFGKNQVPAVTEVQVLQGIRAEPETPEDPAFGKVWRSIVTGTKKIDYENEFISSGMKPRELYSRHPWSLVGGGAVELKLLIETKFSSILKDYAEKIGPASFPGIDEAFVYPKGALERLGVENEYIKPFVTGEELRDWSEYEADYCIAPYDKDFLPVEKDLDAQWYRCLWPLRTVLENVVSFAQKTCKENGDPWWEWYRWIPKRFQSENFLAFPFVASHNHFVRVGNKSTFNRSTPVVINKPGVGLDELQAYLNSSVACFLMKQVSQQKQLTGGETVRIQFLSKVPYEFGATQLENISFPNKEQFKALISTIKVISTNIRNVVSKTNSLYQELSKKSYKSKEDFESAFQHYLDESKKNKKVTVFLQEEIDWRCYEAIGLCGDDCLFPIDSQEFRCVNVGSRPFEIEEGVNQDGFNVSDIDPDAPNIFKECWARRRESIKKIKEISILENALYKRRWIGRQGKYNHTVKKNARTELLKALLISKLEDSLMGGHELTTCAKVADSFSTNTEFQILADLYIEQSECNLSSVVSDLVQSMHVPCVPQYRYKQKGLVKYQAWKEMWEKQRLEDFLDHEFELKSSVITDDSELASIRSALVKEKADRIGKTPTPPKYSAGDFKSATYWPLRGKFDVAKEAFFSLLGCEKDGDTTLVIGWAGMNRLQRAQAIAAWYLDRKESDGWEAEKLMPMLVALDELIPWLKQWHNEIDPEFGERMGDYYEGFLLEEMRQLSVTKDDLLVWEPPAATRTRRRT
jgi:hypothetical protein